MRSRWWIAFLGLALLAFAAWWFLRSKEGAVQTDPAGVRRERADTKGKDFEAEGPTLKVNAPTGTRPARARHTLTVRLHGLSAEEAMRATVLVNARPNVQESSLTFATEKAGTSGVAVVDVSHLAAPGDVVKLLVTAETPDHLRGIAHVVLPAPEARAAGLDLAAEIHLVRAAVLVGRVVDEDGRSVKDTTVVVDVPGGQDEETPPLRSNAALEEDGRFRLRVKPGPDVVVLAWAPGKAPAASRTVSTKAGETVDVGTLRLLAPQTWEGRVRGAAVLDGHAMVSAHRLGRSRPSEIGEVVWRDDTLEPRGAGALAAEDESFVLAPIAPGWWRIEVRIGGAWRDHAHTPDVAREAVRIAHTRERFLLLDVQRALLRVRVTRGDQPVHGAQVVVAAAEALSIPTKANGEASIVVRPSTEYEVRVFFEGAVGRTTLTSPSAGREATVSLALEATKKDLPPDLAWARGEAPPAGAFTLEVIDPGGLPAPARLRVTDADGKAVPTSWLQRGMIARWRTVDRLLGNTTAELLTDLPPGDYTLRVELDGCRSVELPLRLDGKHEHATTVNLVPE